MKFIVITVFLFSIRTLCAQNINREDPTYMEVNHRYMAHLIDWSGADYLVKFLEQDRYAMIFSSEEIPDSAGLFDIHFDQKRILPKLSRSIRKLDLFKLDTANLRNERAYLLYANKEFFDTLVYVDAVHLGQEEEKVGCMTAELLAKISAQDLCSILIHFGVIGTYHHLYSELVTTKKVETDTRFEINYYVQWHLCTNGCHDPVYEFGIKIDKETGDIFAFRL
jgi:hypothetical protein